ncbi:hypothetical protein BRYFOR_08290 [Marvinbryantia formatexigens DSM 14469]|uniref:Uncharacterized protein n=1 Tax=Marvinbryantia formatexigens DSM 14469 TaxID=478749 RepID=C6LI19_9FIRM|nr:hypothetical protein BRYFOR_08290 [Marvinbryantia formatexigens DSM 14469]
MNHERIQYGKRLYGICGRRIPAVRQRSGLYGMAGGLAKMMRYAPYFYADGIAEKCA